MISALLLRSAGTPGHILIAKSSTSGWSARKTCHHYESFPNSSPLRYLHFCGQRLVATSPDTALFIECPRMRIRKFLSSSSAVGSMRNGERLFLRRADGKLIIFDLPSAWNINRRDFSLSALSATPARTTQHVLSRTTQECQKTTYGSSRNKGRIAACRRNHPPMPRSGGEPVPIRLRPV